MLTIISPSKTQDINFRAYPRTTIPQLLEKSKPLVEKLRAYTITELATLMKMSPKLAELNWQRYRNFQFPPDETIARQALLTFRGDVYNGIECASYSDNDFSFAQDHVRILSGLYGVLRPLDLIQPYRLEMSTRFSKEKGDSLYDFWGEEIAQLLNGELADSGKQTLVNLASAEYSKAVRLKIIQAKRVDVIFRQKKGEDFKVIPIHAKRGRGLMVNHIIRNRIDDPEGLKSFSRDGYRFKAHLSTPTLFTFDRDK